ncbi:Fe-S cluster protein [Nocardioides sp. S5]|uniref:(Fe-S)-binding protein n=1 Tax=Nocardioides sp. S5 TaxID=2017486 RepID=UPI001A8C0AC3|nr:(Fe-S)-binding protein [Nocardioides sp. S5]QSR33081.1 Fe-S cluster protein [Nocardioides sp. S5]
MQMIAIVVSFALTAVAVAMLVPAVRRMLGVIRAGQPAPGRTDNPAGRTTTMLKETFLHTRMLQWHWVGIMHWFVYAAFLFLSTAVLAAYFQLFEPSFAWPLIGHWYPYEWFSELIGLLSTVGIIYLILVRQRHHPRSEGRRSRFFGSNFWQAYFVEALALLEGAAILFVRAAEWKLDEDAGRSHYPIASWIGDALYPNDTQTLENLIYGIAAFKISLAMIWLMVIARNITMGVAWHRFTAWFNIWFKRESDGSTALGAMKPLMSDGKAVTLDDIDDLDEDSVLGVGKVEDFAWKGILDFTTCTECGRCQSQCPAWNTEKPLSPKLLITALRDHAYAKHDGDPAHAERELVGVGAKGESGGTAGADVLDYFYNPEDAPFVIDEDVLWSCTSCGACVQQCPVDIEHVDHIMDMRRYQLLVESNFPAELNQLFKGLENKGNPWNMSSTARMDWAKGLDFEVPVVGEDLESLESVDWLFWVGCAGAYEDRAKKTTRAVAELLDMAGISFGVLGNGETCTGDPARRAGNEFVFQGLAQQNVETFKEYKVKKVVSTCAHCFNTLKNEYKDFGIELEVVHHTQLLNRLVREGRLTPVTDGAGAAKRSITYHDPCYLGRHNEVYSPPRELLQVLPGAEVIEMERNSEKSFCCGAGGARMWMEENIGERINMNRTKEAVGTGADQIAVGCPFCRVMLSDGLTMQQSKGEAREEVEVLDVAQMLLASVKGEQATKAAPGSSAAAAPAAAVADTDVATKDEPEAGDVTVTEDTVTETADVGPAAKASGGSSLFDTPAPEEPAPAEPASAAKPAESGSLFDTPAPEPTPEPTVEAESPSDSTGSVPAETPATDLGAGGSLFDLGTPSEPETAAAEPAVAVESPSDSTPSAPAETPAPADLGGGGSLFDIAAPEAPAPRAAEPTPEATPEPEAKAAPEPEAGPEQSVAAAPEPVAEAAPAPSGTTSTPTTDADLSSLGSLFDLEAPATTAAPAASAPAPAAEPEVEATPEAEAEAEAEAQPEPEPVEAEPESVASEEPAAAAPSAPASSGATSTPTTDVDISGLGSLFDLEAPATTAAPAASAPAPAAEPEAQVEAEPAASTPSSPPSGADLSRAATFADPEDPAPEAEPAAEPIAEAPTVDDPETVLDADDVPADEPAAEEPEEPATKPATKPAPSTDGPAHTPRTDVDISGSGSLFDL